MRIQEEQFADHLAAIALSTSSPSAEASCKAISLTDMKNAAQKGLPITHLTGGETIVPIQVARAFFSLCQFEQKSAVSLVTAAAGDQDVQRRDVGDFIIELINDEEEAFLIISSKPDNQEIISQTTNQGLRLELIGQDGAMANLGCPPLDQGVAQVMLDKDSEIASTILTLFAHPLTLTRLVFGSPAS